MPLSPFWSTCGGCFACRPNSAAHFARDVPRAPASEPTSALTGVAPSRDSRQASSARRLSSIIAYCNYRQSIDAATSTQSAIETSCLERRSDAEPHTTRRTTTGRRASAGQGRPRRLLPVEDDGGSCYGSSRPRALGETTPDGWWSASGLPRATPVRTPAKVRE